jgi:hypothetical protein
VSETPARTWKDTMPRVGQTASRSRRIEPEYIRLFTEISGDRNPLHCDEIKDFTDYCVRQGWMSGREYLTSVEAGSEIWHGQDQLDTSEFSVTIQ